MSSPFGDGPVPAKIMLVGDFWSTDDEHHRASFQGYPGELLAQLLHKAGIMRSECYATSFLNCRPPFNNVEKWIAIKKNQVTVSHYPLLDKMVLPLVIEEHKRLMREIEMVQPNVIVTFGNAAMWALTKNWSVLKWRGSMLTSEGGIKVIPTIHPYWVQGQHSLRKVVTKDLERAAKEKLTKEYAPRPAHNFIIRPSFDKVMEILGMLEEKAKLAPLWVEFDIETTPYHIDCFGLSWSLLDAICVPITTGDKKDYWSVEEEAAIIHRLYQVLTNPNIWVRGQNLLYDCQHTYRWWHFVPNVKQDTMISHHSTFCELKKSLDFQASLYAEHYVYWKDMAKDLSNKAGA